MRALKLGLVALLLAGCGVSSQPGLNAPADRAHRSFGLTQMKSDEVRFLTIAGSQVTGHQVNATAAYSGMELPDDIRDEFDRRYGFRDYVVIQIPQADGTVQGRVYAYRGDSSGVNAALAGAPENAVATVRDEKGRITYQGTLLLRHDFLQAEVRKTVTSPDGQWTAKIYAAGYRDPNYLIAQGPGGVTYPWQAGSRQGDLFLDAQWLPNGVLLTYEGTVRNRLVFQTHNKEHYVSEVLGVQVMTKDAQAAGLDLDPGYDPVCTWTAHSHEQLSYQSALKLADGMVVLKKFQGTLKVDAQGMVQFVDRHLIP